MHKSRNCSCQDNHLSPADTELAKKAALGIPYYIKFCSILLRINTKIPLDGGRARYSKNNGSFWVVDSNQKLKPKTVNEGLKGDNNAFSYSRGRFHYKNKPFVLKKVAGFKNKKFAVTLNDKETLVLDFIPNNSWTFQRMVKNFYWNKYDFADSTQIKDFKKVNFKYTIFPGENLIMINGKKVEIIFHHGQLLMKDEDMLTGRKVSFWNE